MSAADVMDTAQTVMDPNASTADKLISVGGTSAGLFLPGALYGKAAKKAKNMVSRTKGTRGFRYMTEGEITAIRNTGKLRGGNPGETFFTKDLYKSGTKAQERLALPTKPTHRVEFEISNNPKLQLNGTKVKSDFGQPGKGSEFMSTSPIEVDILNIQPIK